MKQLYLLEQEVNQAYDTYDSCVVCAETEEEAKEISPDEYRRYHDGKWWFQYSDGTEKEDRLGSWARPEDVKVRELGIANDSQKIGDIICSSYNAG